MSNERYEMLEDLYNSYCDLTGIIFDATDILRAATRWPLLIDEKEIADATKDLLDELTMDDDDEVVNWKDANEIIVQAATQTAIDRITAKLARAKKENQLSRILDADDILILELIIDALYKKMDAVGEQLDRMEDEKK